MEDRDGVRRYRLQLSTLGHAKQRQIRSALPQLLVMLLVVLLPTFFAVGKSRSALIFFLLLDALYIAYIAAVTIPRMRKRLAKCWETYVLEIGPGYLLRQQVDTPEIRMSFSNVNRIEHLPGRYLRVIGNTRRHVIGIPEGLENFSDVLLELSTAFPAKHLNRDRTMRNTFLTGLAFGAYMLMLWMRTPRIVIPLALVVAIFLVWLFVFIQRSPNVSYRSKRISWLYLLFLGICALKVLSLLTPTSH
jgi:hypothetical protein